MVRGLWANGDSAALASWVLGYAGALLIVALLYTWFWLAVNGRGGPRR